MQTGQRAKWYEWIHYYTLTHLVVRNPKCRKHHHAQTCLIAYETLWATNKSRSSARLTAAQHSDQGSHHMHLPWQNRCEHTTIMTLSCRMHHDVQTLIRKLQSLSHVAAPHKKIQKVPGTLTQGTNACAELVSNKRVDRAQCLRVARCVWDERIQNKRYGFLSKDVQPAMTIFMFSIIGCLARFFRVPLEDCNSVLRCANNLSK